MKTSLGIGGRLLIINLLPKEGNILQLRMIRNLVERVGLSAEDITEFGVRQEGQQIVWNPKGAIAKEFEFRDAEVKIIADALKALDSQSKLTADMIPLYDAFVGEA